MDKRWKNVDCVTYTYSIALKKDVANFGKHDILKRSNESGESEHCKRCELSFWKASEQMTNEAK
jgi:hypothetical protein